MSHSAGPEISAARLRSLIQSHFAHGRLPKIASGKVKANYGSLGSQCAVCGGGIEQVQVEYEVFDAENERLLFFHITCHDAWQEQCIELYDSKTG